MQIINKITFGLLILILILISFILSITAIKQTIKIRKLYNEMQRYNETQRYNKMQTKDNLSDYLKIKMVFEILEPRIKTANSQLDKLMLMTNFMHSINKEPKPSFKAPSYNDPFSYFMAITSSEGGGTLPDKSSSPSKPCFKLRHFFFSIEYFFNKF